MTRAEIFTDLAEKVAATGVQNEGPCGQLLRMPEAASVLLPPSAGLVVVDTELRTASGDTDLLVVADESTPGGQVSRRLYVWELKAPQVPAFCVETLGRACPSKELYTAENQLLHYHAQLAGSEQDRKQFGVRAAGDVRLGGIIIGTKDSFVAATKLVDSTKARRLANATWDIRDQAFYLPSRMRLLDWDLVLSMLSATIDASYTASPSVPVPLSTGPTVGSTGALLPGVSLEGGDQNES